MTITSIALYLALIVWVVAKRLAGRPMQTPKKLLLLPAVLVVIGFEQVAHGHLDGVDIGVAVIGSAISLALGAVRGGTDRISERNGYQWVRWSAASVGVLAATVAVKLVLDVASVAAGGTTGGATASLVLSLGMTLLGEGLVLAVRSNASRIPLAPVA